jgi:hypothetical protein
MRGFSDRGRLRPRLIVTSIVAIVTAVTLAGVAPSLTPGMINARAARTVRHNRLVAHRNQAKPLLGIDVWWRQNHGLSKPKSAAARSEQIVRYIRHHLHANAVSISFPVFVSGLYSDHVFTNSETPSVQDVGIFLKAAEKQHLRLQIRPLLDIDSQKYEWRANIRPKNLHDFFHSYFECIRPYLELAHKMRIATFVYASELSYQAEQPKDVAQWRYLIKLMRGVYRGKLEYDSAEYQYLLRHKVLVPGYAEYTDGYFPEPASYRAPERRVYDLLHRTLSKKPASTLRRTVLQEVGIAAVSYGYRLPSAVTSGTTNPKYFPMQARWFDAMCKVVHRMHLAGIYFWTIYFQTDPYAVHRDSRRPDPTQWLNRPGGAAIASCFAHF